MKHHGRSPRRIRARSLTQSATLVVVAILSSCTPTGSIEPSSPASASAPAPEPPSTAQPKPETSTGPTQPDPTTSSKSEQLEVPKEVEAPKDPPPPEEPKLVADDGSVLPQTEDRPASTPLYEHHEQLLFEAIVKDDPELARPFFFPLVAYEQVKAIAKPSWDWNNRLWKHFVRDIHEYHAKLGDNPEAAVLEHIALREPGIQWMKPHSEGNRLGYFRVTRSRIQGRKANGDPIDLELTSMISWRGEWYVVHLHGFR